MAIKRMFNKNIIETDTFCNMEPVTQLLYIHFGLNADDDGIIDNYNILMRCYGADAHNLQELIKNGYVVVVDSVLVIVHWKINNHIRTDRYTPTLYQEQHKKLTCNNGVYSLLNDGIPSGIPNGIPNGIPSGIHSIDKVSIDKVSIDKGSIDKTMVPSGIPNGIPSGTPNTPVTLTEQEQTELYKKYSEKLVNETISKMNNYLLEKNKTYKHYFLQICSWIERDYTPQQIEKLKDAEKEKNKLKDLEEQKIAELYLNN